MRKLFIILNISLISFWLYPAIGQENIPYGSNNGEYISIDNTRIYYEEYGKGTPLILLHGGTSSMKYYGMVIPELSKKFRVIAVDSPGHGRSEHTDTLSYKLIADYFSEMIDIMDFDSAYVLGCSDGAIVALILAYNRPDKIKRVISDGGISNLAAYTSVGLDWVINFGPQTLSERWINWYKEVNPNGDQWQEYCVDAKKMWTESVYIKYSELRQIKSRTLIIMGDRDFFIPVDHGLQLYKAIKGSELCVIPNMGHAVCNKKPDLINNILLEFLSKK